MTAGLERKIQAPEMEWYLRLLSISYIDSFTNEEVRIRGLGANVVHDDLLTTVKKRKFRWFDLISRSPDVAKGSLKRARTRERQKNR